MTLREEVKANVLTKLSQAMIDKIANKTHFIDELVEEVEQHIKNYCYICTVPYALRFTWSNIVVDYVKYKYYDTLENNGTGNGDGETILDNEYGTVGSMEVGDTKVDFKGGGNSQTYNARDKVLKGHSQLYLDDFVFNYKSQLNQFRKVKW